MTCKDCRYGIPDTDMGGYECELDHGLRYGYGGCDAETLKAKITEALPTLCDNDLAACPNTGSALNKKGDRAKNKHTKMGKPAAERQVIVTWYKPEEKLPPDGMYRYVTFSGETKSHIYDHAMGVAKCYHEWADEPPAWAIDGLDIHDCVNCIIEAWADLEPFAG